MEDLTDDEILAWMREHAAEHTIRGMVLTGELVDVFRWEWPDGRSLDRERLERLADQVQAEVDAARQARERGEG